MKKYKIIKNLKKLCHYIRSFNIMTQKVKCIYKFKIKGEKIR